MAFPSPKRTKDTFFPAVGRLLLVVPFLWFGCDMFWNAHDYEGIFDEFILKSPFLKSNLPLHDHVVIVYAAAGTMLLSSLGVLFGFYTRFLALPLAILLAGGTIVFHVNMENPLHIPNVDAVHIVKNLSIIGGLLLVTSHGSGALGLDHQSPTTVGWAKKRA